jgi:hypothetical protein
MQMAESPNKMCGSRTPTALTCNFCLEDYLRQAPDKRRTVPVVSQACRVGFEGTSRFRPAGGRPGLGATKG